MLSGISRKRSIRSNPYWFTEFCNSQCLSHFAAPFIVVRAETSVAESCKTNGVNEPLEKIQVSTNAKGSKRNTTARREGIRRAALTPYAARESLHGGIDAKSPSPPRASPRFVHVVRFGCVRMILPQVHLRKPCYDFSFL